jgi:NAD(P)-dependent dehydrogenase (short-subunit alcohol dehydrogenase family)
MDYSPPNSQTVFLVSGGARGITAQCAIQLAERFHSRFILLGRSACAPEPAWAAGASGEAALKQQALQAMLAQGQKPKPAQLQKAVEAVLAAREIQGTLAAIAAAGGHADYLSADVTNAEALGQALDSVRAGITGIVHGAGALADKLIESKTEADFEKVYLPKIQGLANLLACVPPSQLQYLVLFSSVAGFYGNAGQADYALANEILNKAAHLVQGQQPACRVLAVDWGPWEGGMVTPELKRLLTERNVPLIKLDEGAHWLADALAEPGQPANPIVQMVVGEPLLPPQREPSGELRSYRIRRRLTLEANPFLRDHVIGGHAVLPTVCAIAWMSNACEQFYPGYQFFRVDHYQALKGIVFDETLADEYILDLKEVAKSAGELIFDGTIWSTNAAGKRRYHYRANLTLCRERPVAPEMPLDRSATYDAPGAPLYDDNILFHGPCFRGIDRVLNMSENSLTTRCVLPEISREMQGQFPVQSFNPFLADVQLQSLLVWAKHTYGYGGLPLRIERGEKYLPIAFGEPTYATLTIRSRGAHSLIADVTVHNEQGQLYSQTVGAEITLSPRLNDLFQQNQISP